LTVAAKISRVEVAARMKQKTWLCDVKVATGFFYLRGGCVALRAG